MGVITKTTENINGLLDKTQDWKDKGIEWNEVINKPHWVTSASKPTYTAEEVGALPSTTFIPTKTSDLENDSNFTSTSSFKTINGQSIVGKGNIEISGGGSGGGIADAPADNNIYGRKNNNWEIIPTNEGGDVTKEAVEKVLTGNIQSHTHDATYEYGDYDVDVWDGTAIATSVQGSGTKEDPYLISSCAEWLYFWNNSDSFIPTEGLSSKLTELVYFVKLTKSLDFNNKSYVYQEQSKSGACDVDGNRATISNFIIDDNEVGDYNMFGLANNPGASYFHHFNLVNIIIRKTVNIINTNSTLGFDCFVNGQNAFLAGLQVNNYIDVKIVLSGSLAQNADIMFLEAGFGGYLFGLVPDLLKKLFRDKDLYFGGSISIEDNTIKTNNAVLSVYRYIIEDTEDVIGGIGTIIGYDNSFSNILGFEGSDMVFDEGSIQNIMAFLGRDYSNIYCCSEKCKGFVTLLSDGSATFINTQGKTLEELNSDTFIDTILNSKEQVFKKGTETPVLFPSNKVIKYDGYVKQSEFEEYKSTLNIPENPFVLIDLDINGSINALLTTPEDQIKVFGKSYDVITKENIIEKLGGIEGIRELYKKLNMRASPKFVCFPTMLYVLPMVIKCNYIAIGATSENPSVNSDYLPDNASVYFIFYSYFMEYHVEVDISITNFNTPEMTVEYKTKNSTSAS